LRLLGIDEHLQFRLQRLRGFRGLHVLDGLDSKPVFAILSGMEDESTRAGLLTLVEMPRLAAVSRDVQVDFFWRGFARPRNADGERYKKRASRREQGCVRLGERREQAQQKPGAGPAGDGRSG